MHHLHPATRRREPEVSSYADGLEFRGIHARELRKLHAEMG
jgi:hypothetical protein